jgi:enamine deaminase RidA (YjgF/YER057c/UK114 family)
MSIDARLAELGIELPAASAPAGNYVPVNRTGNLLYTSGQIPVQDGEIVYRGYVGADFDIEPAYAAARLCTLSALAAVRAELGSLDRVAKVVKVTGFVRSSAGFTDQPKVINGASDLLVEIFGDKGRHARAAVGVNELPLGVCVEVEFIFEITD